MVKPNLANRLAAGGFWALRVAEISVEAMRRMRESDWPAPLPAAEHDPTVFSLCGAEAFKLFLNANMDNARVQFSMTREPTQPQKYDRDNSLIPHDVWQRKQETRGYRDVDKWSDGRTYVSTIWVGYDQSGCQPPHLFKTFVVDFQGDEPVIKHSFGSHSLPEARLAHRQVVLMVKRGAL